MVKLRINKKYKDLELKKQMHPLDIIEVSEERARYLLQRQREKPNVFGFTILKIDKIK